MTRAEVLAAQRWTRRHATGALFGRARAYARPQGPTAGAALLAGLLLAGAVWVAPTVVDVVSHGTPTSSQPDPAPATTSQDR